MLLPYTVPVYLVLESNLSGGRVGEVWRAEETVREKREWSRDRDRRTRLEGRKEKDGDTAIDK